MEGRQEEYLASRAPKPIAHIAEIEDNPTEAEDDPNITAEDSTLNVEFAAMSLGSSNEISFSTYALSSITELLPNERFALTSITHEYNSALDSACMNHIFRDRNVFHTYDINGAVPVKTANCGSLNTLGIGDVKIRLTIDGKLLYGCLRTVYMPLTSPSI